MEFTEEEQRTIEYYAHVGSMPGHELGFWLAVLLPIVGFVLYGAILQEPVALTLASVALIGVLVWIIVSSQRSYRLYAGIFRKLQQMQEQERLHHQTEAGVVTPQGD